jgi:hypothetical protein
VRAWLSQPAVDERLFTRRLRTHACRSLTLGSLRSCAGPGRRSSQTSDLEWVWLCRNFKLPAARIMPGQPYYFMIFREYDCIGRVPSLSCPWDNVGPPHKGHPLFERVLRKRVMAEPCQRRGGLSRH